MLLSFGIAVLFGNPFELALVFGSLKNLLALILTVKLFHRGSNLESLFCQRHEVPLSLLQRHNTTSDYP